MFATSLVPPILFSRTVPVSTPFKKSSYRSDCITTNNYLGICSIHQFCPPQKFTSQMSCFNIQIGPVITPGNGRYVHHILIYECSNLNGTHVGHSAPCNTQGEVANMVQQCRGGILLTGWAVGGTVSLPNIKLYAACYHIAMFSVWRRGRVY